MVETLPQTQVPIHVIPDTAFVFRYLVTVHAVTCYSALVQNLALRLRPTEESSLINKMMLWACVIVPIIQFPISVFRVVASLSPEFSLQNPLEAYLNFFWSPMCTIYLVWLVQVYMATKCKTTLCRYLPSSICVTMNKFIVAFAFLSGVVFSHLFYAYLGVMDNHNVDLQLRITAFCSLIVIQLESAYHHGHKKITLVSYGLMFFAGTWLYFIRFVW